MSVLQASLFDAEPMTLVTDAEGGIRYWPQVIDSARAQAWFEILRSKVAWKAEQRPMYDRIVDVPRLHASLALASEDGPHELWIAREVIHSYAAAPFTHVGLNLYRDAHDSVAMHNDKLQHLSAHQPIAILSLGESRDMLIRAKGRGSRVLRMALESGSLLVMSHASQYTHEHGIPKSAHPRGPRISCAFRVRH